MTSIATVWVTVMPETSRIAPKLREAFRAADSVAREAGERWGREIERGIGSVKVDLDADTTDARRELDSAAADRRSTVHLDVDRSSIDRLMSSSAPGLGNLKMNVGLVGVGLLPAAATGLAEVAGAAQQLAGASLALPGVFSGLIATVGTAALGMHGMKDALTAVNKAADGTQASVDAANKALADLAPNAADTVRAAAGLRGTFSDLQHIGAQDMFAGVAGGLRNLVGQSLPELTRGIDGISRGLNRNILQLMSSLGSAPTQGFLDRILGNSAEAQTRLTAAINPLVHAMGTLATAGSDTLPRLATALGNVATRFDAFISNADADGRLGKWINDGISGLTQLGNIALDLGKSFTAITQAAGGGIGLLGTLQGLTSQMSTFLNSARGQDTLKGFFADGRNLLGQLRDIAVQLEPLLPEVFRAASNATNFWLPLVRDALQLLNSIPGGAGLVVNAFIAWKTIDGISSLAGSLNGIVTLLRVTLPEAAATGAASMSASGAAAASSIGAAFNKLVPIIGSVYAAYELGKTNPAISAPPGQVMPDGSSYTVGPDGKLTINQGNNSNLAGGGGQFGPSPADRWLAADQAAHPQPVRPPGQYRRRDGSIGTVPVTPAPSTPAPAVPTLSSYAPPVVTEPSGGGASGSARSTTTPPPAGYTSDVALLANVPAGHYSQTGNADLIKGLGDCSSAVEDLVNIMDGRPTSGRSMSTGNAATWLAERGFLPTSAPVPGAFNVGFNDHHMQATLPGGTPFNWGSDEAAQRGGVGGTGASDPAFTQHFYRPVITPTTDAPQIPLGPTGTPTNPYYMQYPDGYTPPGPDMSQLGQSLGGDLMSQILPDGFKDPTKFGGVKLATGFLNGLLGLNLGGGDGASAGAPAGGGGSGAGSILSGLLGITPQPVGALNSGSPGNAPGQFMPAMPNPADAAISPFQVTGPPGTAGPGNQVDNRIIIQNPVGQDHLQGMVNTATQAQVPRVRQGVRALP